MYRIITIMANMKEKQNNVKPIKKCENKRKG